jgi:DNA-binding transcriptional MerR regulator
MTERPLHAVDPPGNPEELTIDQLSRETGMTVRNIRNHQSRGLLQPPDVRARIGYYGSEHVERLQLIREMQADGFNLEAIRRLLDEGVAGSFVGLKRAATAPFESERAEIITAEELLERFGDVHPKVVYKAQKLGLLVPLADGRIEVPSPALLRAAEEVMKRGVPLSAALTVVEQVKRSSESVARAFVRLFLEDVWKPFEADGASPERLPEVIESIERLRPIASEVLLAVFEHTMTAEVEDAFGKELERAAKRTERSSRRGR